jgi:ribose-phosphate pyrophosphokinase
VLIKFIRGQFYNDLAIVSPDAGGVERARAFAKRLDADLAIIDKRRSAPNQAKAMAVIGNVRDKVAVILDDMVDTAGTLVEAAEALSLEGAREIHACIAHAVLSGPAVERIQGSVLKSIVVTPFRSGHPYRRVLRSRCCRLPIWWERRSFAVTAGTP